MYARKGYCCVFQNIFPHEFIVVLSDTGLLLLMCFAVWVLNPRSAAPSCLGHNRGDGTYYVVTDNNKGNCALMNDDNQLPSMYDDMTPGAHLLPSPLTSRADPFHYAGARDFRGPRKFFDIFFYVLVPATTPHVCICGARIFPIFTRSSHTCVYIAYNTTGT